MTLIELCLCDIINTLNAHLYAALYLCRKANKKNGFFPFISLSLSLSDHLRISPFYLSHFSPILPITMFHNLTGLEIVSNTHGYCMTGILPLKTCSTNHPLLHFHTCASLNSPGKQEERKAGEIFLTDDSAAIT